VRAAQRIEQGLLLRHERRGTHHLGRCERPDLDAIARQRIAAHEAVAARVTLDPPVARKAHERLGIVPARITDRDRPPFAAGELCGACRHRQQRYAQRHGCTRHHRAHLHHRSVR
jgi:hypothetical protein